MRASITLFRPRRDYAATPAGEPGLPTAGALGADDDAWYLQYIGGGPDVNPELTGSQKFRVYDEMSKTDPAIKSLLQFEMLPVRAATWTIEPRPPDSLSEPDAVARAIRDGANAQFGVEDEDGWLDLSWKELLTQGMRETLTMGPCFEEYIWGDLRTWRDADGDEHLLRPLDQVALRPARLVGKVERRNGLIVSMEQELSGTKPIPGPGSPRGSKLSYLCFERDGHRWDGVSMLRAAWGPWTIKKALLIAAGIGWDRFASGLPVVYHPDNPADEDLARRIGRSIRQHERANVHFPTSGPSQGGGRPDSEWFLELVNGASTLADPTPLLKFLSDEIATVGMQQFARQGLGETGARATSETQIDPFFLGVQELADYMRRERSRQLLRRWVEVNFGTEAAERYTPILRVSKIRARNVAVMAQAISLLAGAGLTFTDVDTQNDIRDELGLHDIQTAAAKVGVQPADLEAALRSAGLDPDTLAKIMDALPADVGVTRNRVTQEGQLTA